MSGDRWGTQSARGLVALMVAPDLAFTDLYPETFATPWGQLAEHVPAWLDAGGPGHDDERGEKLAAFLRWVRDAGLVEVDPGWVVARAQKAVNGRPITDPLAELAAVRQAHDDAHDADYLRDLPTAPPDSSAGCAGSAGKDWPTPERLDGGPLPRLDPADLPCPVREWAEAIAAAYQVPLELPAGMALAALSAAVAGKVRVRVDADWIEELCLYVAVVLPSGERKSPVVREASEPLKAWEREEAEGRREEVARGQAARDLLEKRLEAAKRDASRRGSDAKAEATRIEAEEQMYRLAEELGRSRPPVLPRLLADDATPEALTSLLADHNRIAVLSDEGGLFDVLAGRYSDGIANLDAVLKAHDGGTIRVDRKGRPAEFVERPALTLAFAVQPEVLESVRGNRAMRGRGLLARFLYFLPTTDLGRRDLTPPPVPAEVRAAYAERLRSLLSYPQNPQNPHNPPELALTPEAREALCGADAARRGADRLAGRPGSRPQSAAPAEGPCVAPAALAWAYVVLDPWRAIRAEAGAGRIQTTSRFSTTSRPITAGTAAQAAMAAMAAGTLTSLPTPDSTLARTPGIHEADSLASWTTSGGATISASTAPVTAPPVLRTSAPMPAPRTAPAAPATPDARSTRATPPVETRKP
jgi:Protein of unknown function (DUF3987)